MAPQVYARMIQMLGAEAARDGRLRFPGCPIFEEV